MWENGSGKGGRHTCVINDDECLLCKEVAVYNTRAYLQAINLDEKTINWS
jgi:hypothetical protein